ncbi:MAG: hypothetical protein DRJ49_01390 [Thermoprotei archaeon]|nr:MAG: hypothetical protein DRN53_00360 [Thermoprotei archaeon]RLE89949.1 MAG: hypothetical protein DRJ49_01390 [Thermoprotei archaeon]
MNKVLGSTYPESKGSLLPVVVRCRRCSFILYSGEEPLAPIDIMKRLGSRCPRCLSRLKDKPVEIHLRSRSRKFKGLRIRV